MPCGPTVATMRRQSKDPGRAPYLDLQVKGLRFLQVFWATRVLLEPACYLPRHPDNRAPGPQCLERAQASGNGPALSNKTDHSGDS